MNLKIIHVKMSNLAKAPDEIVNIQKKYGKYDYQIFFKNMDLVIKEIKKTDKNTKIILHYHNVYQVIPSIPKSMRIIHYHSEPKRIKKLTTECAKKLVLNQYHCTLDFYKSCEYIVPNTFDVKNITPEWETPIFHPSHIKIVYIPSTIKVENKYYNKGYAETIPVLKEIEEIYGNKVIVVIKSKVPYEVSIKEKIDAHIVIDECVTGSYHKTSIEALSYGSLAFAFLNDRLVKKQMELYGQVIPVCNVHIKSLLNELKVWIDRGKDEIETEAISRWQIFKEHWGPESVVKVFDKIYEDICDKNNIKINQLSNESGKSDENMD